MTTTYSQGDVLETNRLPDVIIVLQIHQAINGLGDRRIKLTGIYGKAENQISIFGDTIELWTYIDSSRNS